MALHVTQIEAPILDMPIRNQAKMESCEGNSQRLKLPIAKYSKAADAFVTIKTPKTIAPAMNDFI